MQYKGSGDPLRRTIIIMSNQTWGQCRRLLMIITKGIWGCQFECKRTQMWVKPNIPPQNTSKSRSSSLRHIYFLRWMLSRGQPSEKAAGSSQTTPGECVFVGGWIPQSNNSDLWLVMDSACRKRCSPDLLVHSWISHMTLGWGEYTPSSNETHIHRLWLCFMIARSWICYRRLWVGFFPQRICCCSDPLTVLTCEVPTEDGHVSQTSGLLKHVWMIICFVRKLETACPFKTFKRIQMHDDVWIKNHVGKRLWWVCDEWVCS